MTDIILQIVIDYLLIIIMLLGPLIIMGFIIGLINRFMHKKMGKIGYKAVVITGAIGTPIHEIGHAIFCLIFGCKITKIKFYDPQCKNGLMGFVNYTFNKKNFLIHIGNFFIALGPVILGTAIIYLFLSLVNWNLIKDTFNQLLTINQNYQFGNILKHSVYFSYDLIISLNYRSIFTYLGIAIVFSVIFHMTLSSIDIQTGYKGFVSILIIILGIHLILSLISNQVYSNYYDLIIYIGYRLWLVVLIALTVSFLNLFLVLIISFIIKLFAKIPPKYRIFR